MTLVPTATTSETQSRYYTKAEYLALEVCADTRNEYRNGEIVPMTGGTPAHNAIAGALHALLWFALRGKPYNTFVTDQRLWIPKGKTYTYPDVMVVQRPVELQAGRQDTVTNPIAIAEVLSKSTEAYDRGEKFALYRTLPSLQAYVLASQYKPHVEAYVRQHDRQWLLTEFSGLEATFIFPALDVEIALADLYADADMQSFR